MNKPKNYDETRAIRGGRPLLPGAYPLIVVGAVDTTSKKGNPMLALHMDISDGDFAGRFNEEYERRLQYANGGKATYPCISYHVYDGDGDTVGRFKGMVELFAQENSDFSLDWNAPNNEQAFIGKVVGGIFREEEYRRRDGEIGTTVRLASLIPLSEIATAKIPPKKTIMAEGFGKLPQGEEEIPF